jgi:hypothetical protein
MTMKPESLKHISGGHATALANAINGTNSADVLCRSGINYPNAVAISKMITAGVGDVGALHRMGYSPADATSLAAAITSAGGH